MLLERGSAQATHTTYQAALTSYETFGSEYSTLPLFPISEENLALFIGHLSFNGKAPSTILTYVAGLVYYMKVNSWEDCSKNFVIRKMLDSLNRAKQPDTRCPVTPFILKKLCHFSTVACTTQYEALLFNTAFLLAFSCFLRISEFTVDSGTHDWSHNRVIAVNDVRIGTKNLEVVIRYSKTDKSGKGVTLCVPDSASVPDLNLRTTMQTYLQSRPQTGAGPLFVHFDGTPLTRGQFNTVLQKILCTAGIKDNIKSHSFRIGAATFCQTQGIPENQIIKMGRWSETGRSHLKYIRLPEVNMFAL